MLNEYINHREHDLHRELREISSSRPRYDRDGAPRRSRLRSLVRGLAVRPARASAGTEGSVPEVVLRTASAGDIRAITRLAEASERRVPSGLVLVAEVESRMIAALPVAEGHALTDLWRPTGDVVQLLELRSEQLRAAGLERAAS
jgi:hypothetical protein